MESSAPIVHQILQGQANYDIWSDVVKTYLIAQGLWDVVKENVDGEEPPEQPENVDDEEPPEQPENVDDHQPDDNDDEVQAERRKKNARALHVIKMSCGSDAYSFIKNFSSAKSAWNALAKAFKPHVPLQQRLVKRHLQSQQPGNERDRTISMEFRKEYEPLRQAVARGDRRAVMAFVGRHRAALTASINQDKDTIFHFAIALGQVEIVEDLVKLIAKEGLEIPSTADGITALSAAAFGGITQIAKFFLRADRGLASIPDPQGMLPVVRAIFLGHTEMTRYLYWNTPREVLINSGYGADFLSLCIVFKCLDIALDLIKNYPSLAFTGSRETLLCTLAKCKPTISTETKLVFWKRWIYKGMKMSAAFYTNDDIINIDDGEREIDLNSGKWYMVIMFSDLLRVVRSYFLKFLGIKKIYEMKLVNLQSQELLHRILNCLEALPKEDMELVLEVVHEATLKAVEAGNVNFVIEIFKRIPEIMIHTDAQKRTIFAVAVEHRQAEVFSLIHAIPFLKDLALGLLDISDNTMLHAAGMLGPSSYLDRIPGAALQMQRELQWFQEVENIMGKKPQKDSLNGEGMHARVYFTKNHKELAKEGAKWMKETATSCSVVAALIVTIVFAAGFLIPGGNDDHGNDIRSVSRQKWFLVFIISDAASLFFSTTSVLIFLGILTSRYYEEAFLKSLPRKLIIGLSTLFFSIATMIIAFSAALYNMLQRQLWFLNPIFLLGCLPVIIFELFQIPLLVEIAKSTYRPRIFKRYDKKELFG